MNDRAFEAQVTDIAAKLIQKRASDEGIVLTLPSVYPSGSPVMVRVSFDGVGCFVNDMGLASHEADLIGATQRVFSNNAREVAREYGVSYDNHCFFAVHVPNERLEGAIKIIGAASHKAVVAAEAKMVEMNDRSVRSDLLDRLVDVFGRASLTKDFSMKGSSSHSWQFAGKISSTQGPVLFDAVSGVASSVYSAHAKFSDIRLLERAPKGVIGIPQLVEFKQDYRNLLQQTANVIDIDSSNEAYSRVVGVAA